MSLLRGFQNEPIVNPWSTDETRSQLLTGIESARRLLNKPQKVLVGEKWVEGEADTFTNVNPNNREEKFGPYPVASEAQALQALEHAKKLRAPWGARPYTGRCEIIRRIRRRFVENKWTILGFLMLEAGKTGGEAYADWAEAVDFLEYYASSCELIHDSEFLALTPLAQHATRLIPKPVGVALSLPPFNFPCAIFTGMWAAPTVMGNVLVVKPSSRDPGVATYLAGIFHEEGAPIQFLLDGHEAHKISRMLVAHPDVALITFTGSRRAGWEINEMAAKTSPRWIKRVVAEMGGCDFIAVHDADNIQALLDAIAASALGYQGQKCSALSRLIVKEDLYNDVRNAILTRLSQIRPKNVVEPDSVMGGVIDRQAFNTILDQCSQVAQAGAKFLLGGRPAEDFPGWGIPPSIHEGLDPYSDAAAMEIFGPVFGIYKAKNFDELVGIANTTPYALTGSVFTTKKELRARAHEFTAGNMYINRKCTGAFVGAEPFGGWYGSGTDDKAGHWSHLLRFIHWQTLSEKM